MDQHRLPSGRTAIRTPGPRHDDLQQAGGRLALHPFAHVAQSRCAAAVLREQAGQIEIATRRWWAMTDSNRRHPACKAGALPTELIARRQSHIAAVRQIASAPSENENPGTCP